MQWLLLLPPPRSRFPTRFLPFLFSKNFYLKIKKKGKTGPASYLYIHGNTGFLVNRNEREKRKKNRIRIM
jgi:hypothetical protein